MSYANPDNGWAYSPIELTAWAKFEANWQEVLHDLAKPYDFHAACAKQNMPPILGISDKRAMEIIARAIIAERDDPDPAPADDLVVDLPEPNDPNPHGGHA